jgi:hypothetical protein
MYLKVTYKLDYWVEFDWERRGIRRWNTVVRVIPLNWAVFNQAVF